MAILMHPSRMQYCGSGSSLLSGTLITVVATCPLSDDILLLLNLGNKIAKRVSEAMDSTLIRLKYLEFIVVENKDNAVIL
jgi:hypothetical protein